jgi:hypothetical protein
MKLGFSEISLIISGALFFGGAAPGWMGYVFLTMAIMGKISQRALEMQQHQKMVDVIEQLTKSATQKDAYPGVNLDETAKAMENILHMFRPGPGDKPTN